MTAEQDKERAFRAGSAMDEFIRPVTDALKAEYLAALTKIAADEPWSTAKMTKLAVALRVIDRVEGQMRAIAANGHVAVAEIDRAKQIADVPEAKRRFF